MLFLRKKIPKGPFPIWRLKWNETKAELYGLHTERSSENILIPEVSLPANFNFQKTRQGWLFLFPSLQTTPWLPLRKHGKKQTLVLASFLKACLLIYLLRFTLNNSTRNCAVQSPSLLAVNHGRLVEILKWRQCFCWFSPADCSALEASCVTHACRCLFLQAVDASTRLVCTA